MRHVGVLAALHIRWPQQVNRLLAFEAGDPDGRLVIECLTKGGTPTGATPGPDTQAATGGSTALPDELVEFVEQHEAAVAMIRHLTLLQPAASME